MKLILFLSFNLAFFNLAYSQIDQQWYVINRMNNGIPVNGGSLFSLEGVAHPAPPMASSADIPRNDIFIIYNNGEYFNSRYIQNYGSSYTSGSDYCLNSTSAYDIEYLYFTNLYEGPDWPPSSVSVTGAGPPPCSNIISVDPDATLLAPSILPGMSLNHDFVPGKDVTLIIDGSILNRGCTAELCYTVGGISDGIGILSAEPIFDESFVYPSTAIVTKKPNGCYEISSNSSPNVFLNFRVLNDQNIMENIMGSEIVFSLNPENENTESCGASSVSDTLRHSHDPNFSQLQSICENENGIFLMYHVEFFNNGDMVANNVSLHDITFADPVVNLNPDNVNEVVLIQDWAVDSDNSGEFSLTLINANTIDISFPASASLGINETAFVEFCVKVEDGVLLEDLQNYGSHLDLGMPNTEFDGWEYQISSFFDVPCKGCPTVNADRGVVLDICCEVKEEVVDPPCPYSPKICWMIEHFNYWWIIGFIGIFIFGGLLFRGMRKSTD